MPLKPHRLKNPPPPGTDEWRGMVTASKIPAMLRDGAGYLGLGYESAFELWLEMTGQYTPYVDEAAQAMFDDAHDVEDYAVNVWRRANPGWQTSRGEVAYTNPALEYPHLVSLDRVARRGGARHIIEVKHPRLPLEEPRESWNLQVLFQMGVAGIHQASIVIVPVYGVPAIHPVEWDAELFDIIAAQAGEFHQLVETRTPPSIDGSDAARAWLKERYPAADATADAAQVSAELREQAAEIWAEYAAAEQAFNDVKKRAKLLENRLIEDMSDSPKLLASDKTLVSRRAGRFDEDRLDKSRLTDEQLATLEQCRVNIDPKRLRELDPELFAAGQPETIHFNRKAFL